MHSHQHFTRSKTKYNHPSKESTISSSINQLRDSFSMASSFTKAEDSSQSYNDHILNPELHSHFGTQHQTTEPKSSPSHHSLKPSPARFSHESGQLLQNEVDRLKAELQMLKSSSQPLIDQMNPSNFQSTISCPTNVSTQSSTITSTIPSIQYVINIDPLQQMKDFVKPFFGNPEDDASKWLASIAHFFDIIRLPGNKDELCFQYAPAFLKTYAYRWWTENKSFISNWSCFKQMFTEQFGEKNEYLLEQQMNQRKQQPNEPVIKYYYDMMELYDYSTPKEFLLKVQQLENIEKLVELRQISINASTTKQQHNDNLSSRAQIDSSSYVHHQNPSSSFSSHHFYQSNVQPDTYDSRYYRTFPNPGRAPQSFSSDRNFQSSSNSTPSSQSNKPSRTKDIQCYHCGKWGHIARNCYQRNNPSSFPSASRQQKNQ
ncbi:unnamed protein product [Rotaria sp. Silwood2]|nr:unnamed protein product [Rotaria sp. Silwood2]CAF2931610.1 unnamed protein product [Rotaria sp. Silwood2]CAF2963314.1 unnamed protein product [Rotaria sp. Silwood2]CAF3338060.1 unnamed protein product [Rotaria sp. Silwood2]CAF4012230.1 unnamed protein product [Rotaria sp. Silwood2]